MSPRININARKTQAIHQLTGLLDLLYPIDIEVKNFFSSHSQLKFYSKGQKIVGQDDVCHYYNFISSGMLRGYILHPDREITTWFSVENELCTSIYSLHQKKPALENIEAVEDSWLLQMNLDDMEELYNKFPSFNINGRKLLQLYYRDAEIRAYLARIPDAEQRYIFFCEQYPHLANRVPLKLIGPYLGMRNETLSRIRKRVKIKDSNN